MLWRIPVSRRSFTDGNPFPKTFGNDYCGPPGESVGRAQFKLVPRDKRASRWFGPFQEKTLVVNKEGKRLIDDVCSRGGFTQGWMSNHPSGPDDDEFTLKKIPVVVLIELMLKSEAEAVAETVVGAYSISYGVHTCLNVLMGRKQGKDGAQLLQKITLHYPSHVLNALDAENKALGRPDNRYPLHMGLALRTAAFNTQGNGLHGARLSMQTAYDRCLKRRGFEPPLMMLDILEDSMYIPCGVQTESAQTMLGKFEKAIYQMEAHSKGEMARAYDPALAASGVTAAREELNLVKKAILMEATQRNQEIVPCKGKGQRQGGSMPWSDFRWPWDY
jgi:hypothetical protein